MVLLMLCVSFVVYVPKEVYGSTINLEGLGDISRYNAVVFGNHKAVGGDIEGQSQFKVIWMHQVIRL